MASASQSGQDDRRDPDHYFNRELSWLEFNDRVLQQGADARNPLLERLKFLAIVSSNLDEFFMVRVAGLKAQLASQAVIRGPDGLSAQEQLDAIAERATRMVQEQYRCLQDQILPGLAEHGVTCRRVADLDRAAQDWCHSFFHKQVFPVLTPLAIDPGHPFPHLRNRSLNLAVTLKPRRLLNTVARLAVVQVPAMIPRLVRLPGAEGTYQFVLLEEIIASQVGELFQGLEVEGCFPFRVTRDSDLNFDEEEAEDLLEAIEQELRKRQWGNAVRLEVDHRAPRSLLTELTKLLNLQEQDVYRVPGPLNLADFWQLHDEVTTPELHDPPFVPPTNRRLRGKTNLFAAIRERDILLHHPYESFSTVVDFVEQAAEDERVLAIKQTLYRTSGDSPIITALGRAAENGKQVTALVELKARFDEENNIEWARRLERAGVHVVYGLIGLKTHCKLILVVRQEEDRVRRYVHLGTGNYHPATAKLYTDIGLLTCSLPYGQDVSRLFNILTGYSEAPHWRRLIVAPEQMQTRMIDLVDRKADHASSGRPARIVAKMNSLVDSDAIEALYRASQAGVPIDLIVRGICCLRPGVPGLSDNIHVRSIVGRFLEHSRVVYFCNGGSPELYAGSADWMPRNFRRRMEALFPIEDEQLVARVLAEVLGAGLAETRQAWALGPDGTYERVAPTGDGAPFSSQEWLLGRAHATDHAGLEPFARLVLDTDGPASLSAASS